MPFRNSVFILGVAGFLSFVQVRAEDAASGSGTAPEATTSESAPKAKQNKPKRRIPREKEAEGTQAPRSFDQSDTIIKSKYEYQGQPLEVDTE